MIAQSREERIVGDGEMEYSRSTEGGPPSAVQRQIVYPEHAIVPSTSQFYHRLRR
jgi:hypothetical protein